MSSHRIQVHPAPDVTIDVTVTGEGRSVVLVHGITESHRTWEPLVSPLVDSGYQVTSIDLRGHGESSRVPPYDLMTMAGDVGAVLAHRGLDDALLVGHSLGGAVVSAYAAGGPCRAVINVDQPLLLAGFKDTLGQLEPLLKGAPGEFEAAITAIFEQMAGPLADEERARVDDLRHADQDVVLGVWDLVFSASAAELDAVVDGVAAAVSVPYLSLHGIDPGAEYGEWLTSRISASTFEVWPDHGHYPHLIDPERFVRLVAEFDPG